MASSPSYLETVVKPGREIPYLAGLGVTHMLLSVPGGFDLSAPRTAEGRPWPALYLQRIAQAEGFDFDAVIEVPVSDRPGRWVLARFGPADDD